MAAMGQRRFFRTKKDAIQGITRPAIRRMARRAGIKRISATLYPDVQERIVEFLDRVLRDAIIITEHSKRKTVSVLDVLQALKRRNVTLYGF